MAPIVCPLALVLLLQVDFHRPPPPPTPAALGLPPQYDLDLPVDKATYDPAYQPPAPAPRNDDGDPRDEPAPVFFGEEIETQGTSLIYVLDFSGSMTYAGRVDKLKQEFESSINGLSPSFRFNVITYDCAMLRWASTMRPATPENKAAAIAWVKRQQPKGGGTGTGPAVALGLSEKSNLAIVLLTDGDPNCGALDREGHRQMIRTANTQGATISVFGIDATGEYRRFCQDVASDSGGAYHDVATGTPRRKS
jgi:hypothetical protein